MKLKHQFAAFIVTALLAYSAVAAEDNAVPQMDPTWFVSQLFWLVVSFLVLYAIVSFSIAPKVKTVLVSRDSAINDAIREAERAKQEAESTRGDVESAGQGARVKASEIFAQAQARNTSEAAQALAKLDHDLARRADQSNAVIGEAVTKAGKTMDQAVADLAEAMVAKLLHDRTPHAAPASLKLVSKR